jgi:hypothetical protein
VRNEVKELAGREIDPTKIAEIVRREYQRAKEYLTTEQPEIIRNLGYHFSKTNPTAQGHFKRFSKLRP